jgi:hypothetical protein
MGHITFQKGLFRGSSAAGFQALSSFEAGPK